MKSYAHLPSSFIFSLAEFIIFSAVLLPMPSSLTMSFISAAAILSMASNPASIRICSAFLPTPSRFLIGPFLSNAFSSLGS